MSKTIVYTICTSSHLGQAKTMADSLLKHNPEYQIVIGLVDRLTGQVDINFFQPHEILLVEELHLKEFGWMKNSYTLLGLTCALKSFYGAYLLENRAPSNLIYIDTDILVTDNFSYLEQCLNEHSIIISPHIRSPYPDDNKQPSEQVMLNVGLYNGGFFAMKNDVNAKEFLNWWRNHMRSKCYEDPGNGLFDDQIWLNFVPLYFKSVFVLDHPGYNVAYWNLHERVINKSAQSFVVNGSSPLVFFHFSGYSINKPDTITRHQNRFCMNQFPDIAVLFNTYFNKLNENHHRYFSNLKCEYRRKPYFELFLNKIKLGFLFKNL